jgi:uncharacterized protein (TIGR02466 family)
MANIHEHAVFITSCYTSYLESIDNLAIIEAIEHIEATKPSAALSNSGGYQSPGISPPDYDNYATMMLFENIIKPAASNIMNKCQMPPGEKSINYWYNVNYKNNYNREHTHPRSYLSGVYYLKVPSDSGNIIFIRSQTELDRLEFISNQRKDYGPISDPRINTVHWFTPKEGLLILFPGHLAHYVEQNLTTDADDRRISLSFNFW